LVCHTLDRIEWSVTRPNCVSVEGKDATVLISTSSFSVFTPRTVRNGSKASDSRFDPDVLALEIAEELEAALEQFAAIAEDLKR
jgi:hypothetical protein